MSSILHVHGDKRTTTTTPIEDAKAFPLLTLPTEILLKIFSYLKREDLTQVKSCNNKSRSIVQQSTFNQFKISYNDLLKNLSLYLTNDDNALLQKNFTSFNQKAYASIGYQIGITLPFDTSKERETLRLTLIERLAKSNKAFNPDSPDCLYIVARDEFSDRAMVWKNAIALPHEFSEILICASALYFFSVHCNNPNNSIQNKIELTKILGLSYISPTYPIVLVRDYHTLILKNIKAALSEQNYCIAVLNTLLLNTDRPAFFCTAIEAYLASNQYDYNTAKALIQADDPKKHSLAVQTWIFEKQIHHFEGSFAEKWDQTFQRYFTDLDETDRSILEASLSLSYISHRQFEDLLT
ncbi:MAG: F-box protein, partial [Chlamydiota bacterium]